MTAAQPQQAKYTLRLPPMDRGEQAVWRKEALGPTQGSGPWRLWQNGGREGFPYGAGSPGAVRKACGQEYGYEQAPKGQVGRCHVWILYAAIHSPPNHSQVQPLHVDAASSAQELRLIPARYPQ